jgi:hypothetical protein
MVAANCMWTLGSIIRQQPILAIPAAITTANPVVDAEVSLTVLPAYGAIVNMLTPNAEVAGRCCRSVRADQVAMDAAPAVTVASAVPVATQG